MTAAAARTTPATLPARQHDRLPVLDVLRFIAALSVVIYHMTFRPQESALFGGLQAVSKYGYLGVDLFFIISGFVILWSAMGRTVPAYLISRVARLFPSFWVAILVTSATMLALRPERLQPLRDITVNFTMVPGYLGASYVDGVYWTLAIELKFYFLVLLCLVFRQTARVQTWLWVWLALTVACHIPAMPHALRALVIFPYGAYFIAGSMFFLTWRDGPSIGRAAALVICLALAGAAALGDRAGFMHSETVESATVVLGFLVVAFAVFGAIALRKFGELKGRMWFVLGTLTYPLYLIHNEVGKVVIHLLGPGVNEWLGLAAALVVVGAVSWSMAALVEGRASPRLRRWLTQLQTRMLPARQPAAPAQGGASAAAPANRGIV